MATNPYTRIELAIVGRLKTGLGNMLKDVGSYGGELDDEMGRIAGMLPAAWVTFGGIIATAPHSTSKEKWLTTGRFAVMVGDQNQRGEEASRHGGTRSAEVGTNALVWAVRRLLIGQDLVDQDAGLQISPLKPGRVRTLFNTKVAGGAMSVFAAEFETSWIEHALPNTRWPVPAAPSPEPGVPGSEYDELFHQYPKARTDDPLPHLAGIDLNYHTPPNSGTPISTDQVNFEE